MIQKIDLIRKTLAKCSRLEYTEEIIEDLLSLDGSILKEACKLLQKINDNPLCGEELQDKYDLNLTGCRKEYFCGNRMRIVWQTYSKPNDNESEAVIWSIAPRKKEEAYRLACERRDRENK